MNLSPLKKPLEQTQVTTQKQTLLSQIALGLKNILNTNINIYPTLKNNFQQELKEYWNFSKKPFQNNIELINNLYKDVYSYVIYTNFLKKLLDLKIKAIDSGVYTGRGFLKNNINEKELAQYKKNIINEMKSMKLINREYNAAHKSFMTIQKNYYKITNECTRYPTSKILKDLQKEVKNSKKYILHEKNKVKDILKKYNHLFKKKGGKGGMKNLDIFSNRNFIYLIADTAFQTLQDMTYYKVISINYAMKMKILKEQEDKINTIDKKLNTIKLLKITENFIQKMNKADSPIAKAKILKKYASKIKSKNSPNIIHIAKQGYIYTPIWFYRNNLFARKENKKNNAKASYAHELLGLEYRNNLFAPKENKAEKI